MVEYGRHNNLTSYPFTNTFAVSKLIVRSGWAHRVLQHTIENVNRLEGLGSELPDLTPQLAELDQKIKNMEEWCAANNPPAPRDIYDPIYTEMPLQLQTYFDTVRRYLCISFSTYFRET
jgi:hypothetical protein